MLKILDLYTYEITTPLQTFGVSTIKYELRKYRDVRNLSSAPAYMLVCTQRIVVPNAHPYQAGPNANTSYTNYPALIVNQMTLNPNNNASIVLKDMFPRTLNTAVATSVNRQSGTTSSSENQQTSGSSTSNINTFGVSLSGGFFGESPVGNLGLEYQHTWESGAFASSMTGTQSGREANVSSGDSMSVKDWSSYGYLDNGGTIPTWVWGQTYPWDVIQYNQSSDGSNINLPSFVQERLLNGTLVLPPSQLSLFGCDFTMKAGWLIEFPQGITSSEAITLTHHTICYLASHSLNGSQIAATLQKSSEAPSSSFTSPSLDMSAYALDPITTPSSNNGAAIGFTTNTFTYAPSAGRTFKIISPENNLQVTGSGFDTGITTNFAQAPSLTVQFKMIDGAYNYSLLLMHWIGPSSSACKMTFTINQMPAITIFVDATEGQGGQKNLSAIDLRNMDFSSINFHDYLVIGLNKITIAIEPVSPGSGNQYTLFALAIGQV